MRRGHCLSFSQAEKRPQYHRDDRAQQKPPYADAAEPKIHGKQRQKRVQTNLCPKYPWLQNLPHHLNDAVNDQIAQSKKRPSHNQMEHRAGPEDKAAAEKGQGIDDSGYGA